MDVSLFLALSCLLAVGLWGLIAALRLPVIWSVLLVLTSVCCFGVSYLQVDAGPITLSLDRASFALLLGIAFLKRFVTHQPKIRFDTSDILLASFLLVCLLGVLFVPWSPDWAHDTPPAYRFVAAFLAPALIYWVMRFRPWDERESNWLLVFLTGLGFYLSAFAVAELRGVSLLPGMQIDAGRELYSGRAVGPFLSAPAFGTLITVCTAALFLLAQNLKSQARLALYAGLPLFVYAQFLCQTRSAWLGFVVVVPFVFLKTKSSLPRQTRVFALVACAGLFAVYMGEKFINPERAEGQSVVARSSNQRVALFQRSMNLFLTSPVWGYGFGQFEHASLAVRTGPVDLVSNDSVEELASHNILFRVMAETGVLGTIPFLALISMWLFRAHRSMEQHEPGSARHSMSTVFIAGFIAYWSEAMFHDPSHMVVGHVVLFFLAGAAFVRDSELKPESTSYPAQTSELVGIPT